MTNFKIDKNTVSGYVTNKDDVLDQINKILNQSEIKPNKILIFKLI